MSTNKKDQRSREIRDPTRDEYLKLEKRLGTAEYELAADVAASNKALGDAVGAAPEQARSAVGDVRRNRGEGRG